MRFEYDVIGAGVELAFSRHALEELKAGLDFREAVVAKLLYQGAGDFKGDHVFNDHTGCGQRAHVASLILG